MSESENFLHKFRYIDQVRGIAILMVILVHTAQRVMYLNPIQETIVKYGQMGVQLFFVASAYTLCNSYKSRRFEYFALISFYIRRFFRISPLYYCGIMIYFGIHITEQWLKGFEISIFPYSVFNVLSNILFIHGFIPSANNSIVMGGWSIGTEMAFYAIFPLLITIFQKISIHGRFFVLLFSILAIVTILSFQFFITSNYTYIKNNSFQYFNLLNQLPVFFLGIAYYFIISNHEASVSKTINSKILSFFSFILFTFLAILVWKLNTSISFILIPTISGISFVFLLHWLKLMNFTDQIISTIGKASYSMYIFHFIFAWYFIPVLFKPLNGSFTPFSILILSFMATVLLTFLIARFTQRTIEAKGIEMGARVIKFSVNRWGR